METFLNKSKYKLEVISKGIESEHKKQITSMVQIFDNEFKNSIQDCYEIDLKSVLIEKMNAYNKKFNFNALLINCEVNNYIKTLRKISQVLYSLELRAINILNYTINTVKPLKTNL